MLVRNRPRHSTFRWVQEFISNFTGSLPQIPSSLWFPQYFPFTYRILFSPPANSVTLLCNAHVQMQPCLWKSSGRSKGWKVLNVPPVWWYFEFWYSSPIHLLLFTFSSQQQLPHASCLGFISTFIGRERLDCPYSILLIANTWV